MNSTREAAFAKLLRTFQTGGISYTEFLTRIEQQLVDGASPTELEELLERGERGEPLPQPAHVAIWGLLEEWRSKADAAPAEPGSRRNSASERAADVDSPTLDPTLDPGSTSELPELPPESATIILGGEDDTSSDGAEEGAALSSDGLYTAPVRVGDVLGDRFYLTELVGEGGMSRVYKSIDARRDETASPDPYVAVKVLLRPFSDDAASFSSLQEEVSKLQSLVHPNIVRTFGCDRDGSTVYMTMEYLVGESLYAKLRTGNAGSPGALGEQSLAIVGGIANALDYAHQLGVVHGDLKPGNVIVSNRGEVKVIDFGIAVWAARPKTASERREAAQGKVTSAVTPRYASPQLMARQKPEIADDVYALACLTYELFTGSHPFDDGTGAQTLRFPPPPRTGLTAPQYAALVKALQFERRKRTASVALFMQEFTAAPRRPRWKIVALAGSVALIAIVAGWFFGHRVAPRPTPPTTLDTAPPASTPVPAPRAVLPRPGSVIRDCTTCPAMTVLPTGQFEQGSADADAGALPFEKPQHPVVIGYAVAMSTTDVTVAEFGEFITNTGRPMQGCDIYDGDWRHRPKASWKEPGYVQNTSHPVTCASWNDAAAYAQWLSAKSGYRYRLPSASEWEYAARAGSTTVRPWEASGADACSQANVADESAARRYPGWNVFACDDGYANTSPVGSFKANAFGLKDMLGNVFQWTQDCWHSDYSGAPADGSARNDGDCTERELRGGSWFSTPGYVRSAYRNHFAADYRTSSVGFRLIREINP